MTRVIKHVRRIALAALCFAALPACSFAASWVDIVYDPGVPPATRANVEKALDTTADLLTRYKLILRDRLTVVVTDSLESYAQARMSYLGEPRAQAEERARYSAGVSSGSRSLIILRGGPDLNRSLAESFRVLPHEIFHQVQSQYGRANTVTWLKEGTPEVFQFVARETAGLEKVADNIRAAEQAVRRAPAIPDARQLASYDYNVWSSLMQTYPVYEMSVLMTNKLVQDNGFDNIVFFYQLLHNGSSVDKAFHAAFRAPMPWFLSDMNDYFNRLRSNR